MVQMYSAVAKQGGNPRGYCCMLFILDFWGIFRGATLPLGGSKLHEP